MNGAMTGAMGKLDAATKFAFQQPTLSETGLVPNLGEGISRTSAKASRLYRLKVIFRGAMPMLETIRATNGKEARKFAKNRYPDATEIELLK